MSLLHAGKLTFSRTPQMDPKGSPVYQLFALVISWGFYISFWVLVLQSLLLISLSFLPRGHSPFRKTLLSLPRDQGSRLNTGLSDSIPLKAPGATSVSEGGASIGAHHEGMTSSHALASVTGGTQEAAAGSRGISGQREGEPQSGDVIKFKYDVLKSKDVVIESKDDVIKATLWKATTWDDEDSDDPAVRIKPGANVDEAVCDGRRIFMYRLPGRFHQSLIDNCENPCENLCDNLCPSLEKDGLGSSLAPEDDSGGGVRHIVDEYEAAAAERDIDGPDDRSFSVDAEPESRNKTRTTRRYEFGPWLGTQQNMIGVVFRARLLKYECLTTDWEKADAVYVPALFGLKTLYGDHLPYQEIETLGDELSEFLAAQPAFKRHDGADHFFVIGQQIWDFYMSTRQHPEGVDWTSYLFYRSALINMAFLSVERFVWETRSQSVPYNTALHPISTAEIDEWVRHVQGHPRKILATMIAGNRTRIAIRNAVTEQCDGHPAKCKRVDCSKECPRGSCRKVVGVCGEPRLVAIEYLSATFCLMPNGDSATRRSTFDAIISGCIPVFFDPDSFQKQYLWYHQGTPDEVSILFNKTAVENGDINFLNELEKVPPEKVLRMRNSGLNLLPRILYKDHTRALPEGEVGFKDAFDVALEGIFRHVNKTLAG